MQDTNTNKEEEVKSSHEVCQTHCPKKFLPQDTE